MRITFGVVTKARYSIVSRVSILQEQICVDSASEKG